MSRQMHDSPWGTDGRVSMPAATPSPDSVVTVDFDGFCFTPDGIRVNMTSVDREELLASGFRPAVGRG